MRHSQFGPCQEPSQTVLDFDAPMSDDDSSSGPLPESSTSSSDSNNRLKSKCQVIKDLELSDIIVFSECPLVQTDTLKDMMLFHGSLRESALLLQSTMDVLNTDLHHVMIIQ